MVFASNTVVSVQPDAAFDAVPAEDPFPVDLCLKNKKLPSLSKRRKDMPFAVPLSLAS